MWYSIVQIFKAVLFLYLGAGYVGVHVEIQSAGHLRFVHVSV